MKQIGLATTEYETGQRQFPQNWGVVTAVGQATFGAGSSSVGQSWLTLLLPYMDGATLYTTTSYSVPNTGSVSNWYTLNYANPSLNINNLTASQTVYKTFLCPSDTQRTPFSSEAFGGSVGYGPTNYKACAGSNWQYTSPAVSSSTGRNAGNTNGLDYGNGIICRGGGTYVAPPGGFSAPGLPSPISPGPLTTTSTDLRDGASKTILAGESVPAWCGWSMWMWFDGSTATCGLPMNYFKWTTPPTDPTVNANTGTGWELCYGFMSRHSGGCNFADCDGGVHFVNEQIDMNVYRALATISGGEASVPSNIQPRNHAIGRISLRQCGASASRRRTTPRILLEYRGGTRTPLAREAVPTLSQR